MEGAKVKTSILFPEELWRRAKIEAANRRADLADIVNNALEAYLEPKAKKTKTKKGGKRRAM
jgi:hypothetical protein